LTHDRTVTPEDAEEIWDLKLDGCSVRYIHEFKASHLSRKAIADILNGPVPERFENDERLLPHRYAWIAASGLRDRTGAEIAFVIVRFDRSLTQAAYRKGITKIRKEFAAMSPMGTINARVTEGIETEIARKFVAVRGTPGWDIGLDGSVRPLTEDDFGAEATAAPAP